MHDRVVAKRKRRQDKRRRQMAENPLAEPQANLDEDKSDIDDLPDALEDNLMNDRTSGPAVSATLFYFFLRVDATLL